MEESGGSWGAGFILGFFVGLIGLVIAIAIDKPDTKKGAIVGFVSGIFVVLIVIVLFFVVIVGVYR